MSRKPSEVWTVSAVPTAWGGTDSVTRALHWALSATGRLALGLPLLALVPAAGISSIRRLRRRPSPPAAG